ncbi:MAG TPA: hypothetical protein VLA29_04760, partial [Acidimicrobiia bacterium]|nr:hypothetical protein [Acidimicrobiia bacterium]
TGSRWMDVGDLWTGPRESWRGDRELIVLTPEVIMVDEAEVSGDVVVWDGDGGPVGVGLAERLAAAGHHVTIATPHRVVAPLLDQTFEGAGARTRLKDRGIVLRTALRLVRGGLRGVRFLDADDESEEPIAMDTLVLVTQRVSNDGLFRTLRKQADRLEMAGIGDVLRIGDCVAPRHFGLAVADGHRLGRELDSGRPERPLEPIVERDHHGAVADFRWTGEVEVPIVRA